MRIGVLCLLFAFVGCAKATQSTSRAPVAPTANAAPQSTAPAKPQSTRCHTADLTATLEEAGAAAGTSYRYVVLTNSNGPTCTLFGYPGVSLVDGSGKQI